MTLLDRLGATMEEQPHRRPPAVRQADKVTADNDAFNENPNPSLTSGFTFVGQFVDHDITFDTTPLDQQQSDPDATTNFRTPRYDLDAIYGRGPNSGPSSSTTPPTATSSRSSKPDTPTTARSRCGQLRRSEDLQGEVRRRL